MSKILLIKQSEAEVKIHLQIKEYQQLWRLPGNRIKLNQYEESSSLPTLTESGDHLIHSWRLEPTPRSTAAKYWGQWGRPRKTASRLG
jgi:hypothetical protein